MATLEKNYKAYNGSKLEYSETEAGVYTQIKGIKQTPDVGGTPNKIDTTDLDNLKYETAINGLIPAQDYTFEFNMEDPSAEANIKLANDLEDSGNVVYWKYTLSNGIIVKFRSDVRTTIQGGGSGDLIGFSISLSPVDEPTKTIPTE